MEKSPANNLLISTGRNKNNFDVLRFFLAAAVIYSHCYNIYYRTKGFEPVSVFTHHQTNLGAVAVDCFFIISGFLIVKSFENTGKTGEYLLKRVLRICPGFFAAFLISVLVVGVIGTIDYSHKFGQIKFYFQHLNRRMILQLFTLEEPKGARTFSTNPVHNKLNEPLWTIQYEFTCYLLVPLLALISVIKRKWFALVFFIISYIVLLLQTAQLIVFEDNPRNWIFLHPSELPRLLSFFFAGSCFYFFKTYIKSNKLLILLSIALILFACLWGQGFKVVTPIAGTYLVFCFAFDPRIQLHNFAKNGDFSYGLYLYGWPIQQLIMYFFGKYIDVNGLFFMAFPMVFLAAYLSWRVVENPFLKMKGQIRKKTLVKREIAVES